MKQKKLSKQLSFPAVVFIQIDRINNIMSKGLEKRFELLKLQDAIDAFESNLSAYLEEKRNLKDSEFKKVLNTLKGINEELENTPQEIKPFLKILKEKYTILNKLAYKVGIYSMYKEDPKVY